MSDKRKILVPKRTNDPKAKSNAKNYHHSVPETGNKQGTKRPSGTKTFANDRLKRLRTSLHEEAKKETRNIFSNREQKQTSKSLQECSGNHKRISQTSLSLHPEKILKTDTQSFVFSNNKKNLSTKENDQGDEEAMEWSNIIEVPTSSKTSICDNNCKNAEIDNKYIIVVDTNILISHLKLVQNIINMNNDFIDKGKLEPMIYIPWMVIEELDFIKDSSSRTNLKCKAQEAVKYIETLLATKHKNIMGQSIMEANGQSNVGNNQDNKIIACCLQVQEKFENVVLLTNDINLRNKAYLNKIAVCSHTEIMSKIKKSSGSKMETVIEKMTTMCTHVVTECLKNAYGKGFHRMHIAQTPPTSLQGCFSVFQKYWFPVFEQLLMKQFRKSVEDFSSFLAQNKGNNDSTQVKGLLKHCLRLSFFLRDVTFCKDFVQKTIDELRILADGECISFKSEI